MQFRIFVLVFIAAAAGCNRQDTDALSRVGQRIAQNFQNQSDQIRDKYQISLGMPSTLQGRVQARLQWEKGLAGHPLEVITSGGEVELKGTLPNEKLRRQAVSLTENTEGVEKVVDSLQVVNE